MISTYKNVACNFSGISQSCCQLFCRPVSLVELRVGLPGPVQGPGRHRGPEDRQTQEGHPPKQLQLGSPGQDSQRGKSLKSYCYI
jgi:hypothetical protein